MVSIIIPTFNEEQTIQQTVTALWNKDTCALVREIIVVDGGSTDDTIAAAQKAGATVLKSPLKGRAAQMNYGAKAASGDILYFIHADTVPPENYTADIAREVGNGYGSGCYRLSFDHDHWFLKANCWFTRFDANAVRFGDQSLFVTKSVFEAIKGYRDDLIMMEDQEIIARLKEQAPFKVMEGQVVTSARKYLDNGIYRLQGIFLLLCMMYYTGFSQKKMSKWHRRLINGHRL